MMDAAGWIELIKVGGPVLAIAVVLLWATLRDKDRMAGQLNVLNAELRDLVKNNTAALQKMTDVLDRRPCLQFREDER
jgi:hypothetical protein